MKWADFFKDVLNLFLLISVGIDMENLKYIIKSWYYRSFLSVIVTLTWFNIQILKKLWVNRWKGNKMRWSMDSQYVLLERLREETMELEVEIKLGNHKNTISEAVDTACFSMFIADRANSGDFR